MTDMTDIGLNYDLKRSQHLRDLGQTSKESWIKRLWNHMFGARDPDTPEEHVSDTGQIKEDKINSTQRRTIKLPSIQNGPSKNLSSVRSQSDNDLSKSSEKMVVPTPPEHNKVDPANDKFIKTLPPRLYNSPYLAGSKDNSAYRSAALKFHESSKTNPRPANRQNVSYASSAVTVPPKLDPVTQPRQLRSKYGHDLTKMQLQKRAQSQAYRAKKNLKPLRLALEESSSDIDPLLADTVTEAVEQSKIFTCEGPYPVDAYVRFSLRKRGWVEKFGPRVNMSNLNSTVSDKLKVSCDEDFDIICGQQIPAPWEEDHGIYAMMSRLIYAYPPKFIWGGKNVNNLILKSDVIVNHFPKAKYFSSKVLLTTSLKELAWQNNADSLKFFPRCYLLNTDDRDDFIEDFHITACISLLKWAIQLSIDVKNELATTVRVSSSSSLSSNLNESGTQDDANIPGTDDDHVNQTEAVSKTAGATTSADHLVQVYVDSVKDTQGAQPEVQDCGEDEVNPCITDIPDDTQDIAATGSEPVKVLPDLKSKVREKKMGTVPLRAVEWAIQQCNIYAESKCHADIDIKHRRGLTSSQWDQLLEWFFDVSQEDAFILNVDTLQEECEECLRMMTQIWPQSSLDGSRNIWIVKPGDRSKGIGIEFCSRLQDILKYIGNPSTQDYVVQKYIERPLLLYNCKFDVRQWFLVTSWAPLTIWFYKDSYLRICSQEFSYDTMHESVHLSNVAVQQNYLNGQRSDKIPENNFMMSEDFKVCLEEMGYGDIWDTKIYPEMKDAVINCLIATQDIGDPRRSAFELYGADFMMSEDCSPWLLEINSSPGMAPTSKEKAKLCAAVIDDTIKVVLDCRENGGTETGRFELAYEGTLVESGRLRDNRLVLEGQKIPKYALQRLSAIDQKATKLDQSNEPVDTRKKQPLTRRRRKPVVNHDTAAQPCELSVIDEAVHDSNQGTAPGNDLNLSAPTGDGGLESQKHPAEKRAGNDKVQHGLLGRAKESSNRLALKSSTIEAYSSSQVSSRNKKTTVTSISSK